MGMVLCEKELPAIRAGDGMCDAQGGSVKGSLPSNQD
jgi:hypothetical protein